MKKEKQEKKKTIDLNKGVKLPLIQSNTYKGKIKDSYESSKGKLFTKKNKK